MAPARAAIRPNAGLADIRGELVRSLADSALDALVAGGVFTTAGIPELSPYPSASAVAGLPAGDFTGDGTPDAAVIRYVLNGEPYVEGRDGQSGALLWTYTGPHADLAIGAPMDIGRATGGVLLFSYDIPAVIVEGRGAVAYFNLRLTALDSNGSVAWERLIAGGPGGATIPMITSFGADLLPGPAADPVVSLVPSGLQGVSAGLRVADVVDGSTGEVGAELVRIGVEGVPRATVVPDVSGDGLSDLLFTGATGVDLATVAAFSVESPLPLWTSSAVPASKWDTVAPVGDVDGDGRGDIAVQNDPHGWHGPTGPVTVLSGGTGAELWSREGKWARAAGDVDGDGRGEVGLQRTRAVNPYGVDYLALRADGSAAYEVPHVVQAWCGNPGWTYYVDRPGDLDGDGVADAAHDVTHCGRTSEEAVSGATGRTLWSGGLWSPLNRSLDGMGDDFYDYRIDASGTRFIVFHDGADRSVLWEFVDPDDLASRSVTAGAIGVGSAADVVVSQTSTSGTTLVRAFEGANGALLWSVAYPGP